MKKLEDYFKNGKVYVWKENFAIAKIKRDFLQDAFATIKDKNATTVIIEESKLPLNQVIKTQRGYKIFTFDMKLPFRLVGFLAKISKALTDKKISIFAISAYSTDHILIRKRDLRKAIDVLKNLRFKVKQNK